MFPRSVTHSGASYLRWGIFLACLPSSCLCNIFALISHYHRGFFLRLSLSFFLSCLPLSKYYLLLLCITTHLSKEGIIAKSGKRRRNQKGTSRSPAPALFLFFTLSGSLLLVHSFSNSKSSKGHPHLMSSTYIPTHRHTHTHTSIHMQNMQT